MRLKHLLSLLFLSLIGLTMATTFTACSGEDEEELAGYNKVVTVKEDGTTSDGSRFVGIDDQNFYLDYIKYTVNQGHLVVSGYDEAGFDGVAEIVSGVNYNGNSYEVLGIYESAFKNCKIMSTISIPNSITYVGKMAFFGCSGLKSINIPNNVTSIGESAFYGCTGLESIIIGNGLTSLEKQVLMWCSSLTSVSIPNSVTKIRENAFSGCSALKTVSIGNGVKEIWDYAFYNCSELTAISIPDSVVRISKAQMKTSVGT